MLEIIVWATDGSKAADRALPYAKALVERSGAKLVVVHAKELMSGRAAGYPVAANEDEIEAKVRKQSKDLQDEGVPLRLEITQGIAGHTAHLIAEAAEAARADVIVVGTRGHGAVAGLLLGSVTQRLLHIAPCPVFAVPDRDPVKHPEREETAAAVR
jgi:nucleotide-binding universal stress UspA family protein